MFDFHKDCKERIAEYVRRHDEELKYYRGQIRMLQERCDRLVEAVARKDGVQLALPIEPYSSHPAPEDEAAFLAKIAAQNRSVGEWVRAINGGHAISTPVKEDKVLAP